jgi:hypothetical protein
VEQAENEIDRPLPAWLALAGQQRLYGRRGGPLPTRDGALQRMLAELLALAAHGADTAERAAERRAW